MFLKQHKRFYYPNQFQSGSVGGGKNAPILGSTIRTGIDRNWAVEEIILFVNFHTSAALTPIASPTTPDQCDNVLSILQHVNLSVNDGIKPRSVVDCSGILLLEYQATFGQDVDQATGYLAAISQVTGSTSIPSGWNTATYRISCPPTRMGESLRSRLYLPIHKHPQDPVLTLSFSPYSNISATGAYIDAVNVEMLVLYREPTVQSENALMATGKAAGLSNPWGYIDWDRLETPYAIALGTSKETAFDLPIPGAYTELLFRHYLGGSTLTRAAIDQSDAPGTVIPGLEPRWRIETQSFVEQEWRWKHLRSFSEMNKPTPAILNTITATAYAGGLYLGQFNGGLVGGNFRSSASVGLDFLTDGLSGDNGTELGSLLDTNKASAANAKMQVIGTPASVSSNASYLFIMGTRIFGNIAGLQTFQG